MVGGVVSALIALGVLAGVAGTASAYNPGEPSNAKRFFDDIQGDSN